MTDSLGFDHLPQALSPEKIDLPSFRSHELPIALNLGAEPCDIFLFFVVMSTDSCHSAGPV